MIKFIKVRVAVAVDPDGNWYATGWQSNYMDEPAGDIVEIRDTYLRYKYEDINDMAAESAEALWHLSNLKDRIVNVLIEKIPD